MPKAIMIRDRFTLKLIDAVARQRSNKGRTNWSKVAGQLIHEHISQTQPTLIGQLSEKRRAEKVNA